MTVQAGSLFSGEEQGHGRFYRLANLLHFQTREALIRRFLLFHEGEPFDEARLRETERNLRNLDFLKSVSVVAGPPHDSVVDVVVTTEDEFTTDVNADFSNDGGRSLYDADVTQKDILGTGAEADFRFANARERRTRSIELLHPALFGPYWNADALLAKSSDGNEQKVSLERPLFSYVVRQTFAAGFDHLLQDTRVYELGRVASLFRQQHREVTFAYGHVIGSSPRHSLRIVAGGDLVSDIFAARQGLAPADRRFRFLETGVESLAFDFMKLDHVDLGLREEDFNLGPHFSVYAAVSPATSKERTVLRFRSDNSVGWAFGPTAFVLSRLTATTRARSANRNAIWSSDTRVVDRFMTRYPQTFAARARIDYGSDLDRDVQFFADGQNGLRAFPNFAFSGSRRIVFNVEHRVFLGRELLQIVEPGAAVFADTGLASSGGIGRGFKTDAGAGLRFGIARFESAIIRIDAAYAFNDSPLSKRGMVFSIATTQAF